MIELLLIWLPACFVVAYVANQKGRSGVGFFVLSFFLTPLIGFLAVIALPRVERKPFLTKDYLDPRPPAPPEEKKCPRCAEMIKAEAQVCRFCGAEQASTGAAPALAAGPVVMGTCPGCRKLRGANVGRCVYCGNTEPVRLTDAT